MPTSARRRDSTAAAASQGDIRSNTHRTCGCAPRTGFADTRQRRKLRCQHCNCGKAGVRYSIENKMTVSQRRALEVMLDVQLDPYYSQAAHMVPGYGTHEYCRCTYEEPGVLSRDTLRHCMVTGKSNNNCLRTYSVRHPKVSLGTSRNCTMDNLNTNSSLCIRTVTHNSSPCARRTTHNFYFRMPTQIAPNADSSNSRVFQRSTQARNKRRLPG